MNIPLKFCISIACIMAIFPTFGNTLSLNDALRNTYNACIGIDDALMDLKKMAGINTAITGVGTAAGAGATVVGIVKSAKDAKAEALEQILKEIEEIQNTTQPLTDAEFATFMSEFNTVYKSDISNKESVQTELDKLNKQSKNLGNWRTGLMAGSAVTNVAGAVIANKNRVDEDLNTQIEMCKIAVKNLQNSILQAQINGEDVSEAIQIANACGQYEYADLSKINTKAKGAMISSAIGATTGITGTIFSATANTDKTRNDNSDAGKQKEKNLNLTSNILAGATTAASATATVFNATQISAIKKVVEIAANCTEVLQ